eukprot:gene27748-31084_t
MSQLEGKRQEDNARPAPGEGVAALGNVCTLPAARRRGLAAAVIARLCADLRAAGAATVALNVHTQYWGVAAPLTDPFARFPHVTGGARVGVVAWTRWMNWPARAGAAPVWRTADVERVRVTAPPGGWAALRAARGVDILIGFPHWGREQSYLPDPADAALARRLASQGFDLICGHGPHVVQCAERVGDCVVVYSIGNTCSRGGRPQAKLGALLRVTFAGGS